MNPYIELVEEGSVGWQSYASGSCIDTLESSEPRSVASNYLLKFLLKEALNPNVKVVSMSKCPCFRHWKCPE